MKYIAATLFFTLTLFSLPAAGAELPKEHFIFQYVEPEPEEAVTPEEMELWIANSEAFAKAEKKLFEAYEDALEDFGPGGWSWLEMNQADWVKHRIVNAFKLHAPKGSPAYLEFMIQEAGKRSRWLKQLGKKGKVVFAQNYLYSEPGYEGMIILYYRARGMEYELYTRNTATGAACEGSGEAASKDGKASYPDLSIEMLDLGKALQVTAANGNALCREGGRFAGHYDLFK